SMGARTSWGQGVGSATRWAGVDSALGRRGSDQPGGVRRYGFPRGDLHVTVGDVQVLPAFALGSWVAFLPDRAAATMTGDLVLTEDELVPVLDRLQQGHVDVTAVHNHLLHETPRVVYMHIHGHGAPQQLAATVHAALALTGTPLGMPPAVMPIRIDLDTAAIARTLGAHGSVNGGVYQVGVPRSQAVREGGKTLPPSMGLATAINFQPLGASRAATTGDFVMTAREVGPVIRALRSGGVSITALHSHMTEEEPRLFFMHFWGEGDAMTLARSLRRALDRMAVKHS
ncbi:MAG TPA: DUF1259 domain-containing protein, partial [Acidimicrobiia bacterium]|nr:DUF1259 domain-containing protein [Acidimicrobiia bacterium]